MPFVCDWVDSYYSASAFVKAAVCEKKGAG